MPKRLYTANITQSEGPGSMSRVRERRRNNNYTGVLRGGGSHASTTTNRTATTAQIATPEAFRWRIVSGILVICLSAVMALFYLSDVFYVHSIGVAGNRYMTHEEVFAYADIADQHIFNVDAEQVRENLLTYPTVADARVRIGWPPQMVQITVEEREPAILWQENNAEMWVDVQGNAMAVRGERAGLVAVRTNEALENGPLSSEARLPLDIVYGILQLHELRPDVLAFEYDPVDGLGFQDDFVVWVGTGTNMVEKLQIYEAIAADIITRGVAVREIIIVNPDAPYTR